jgi:hypothetical protein
MSKRQTVENILGKASRVLEKFFKVAGEDPVWYEHLETMLDGKNPFENWLQKIVDDERRDHKNFFGARFRLGDFTTTLKMYGREKIEAWKKLGLEPHFLPHIALSQDSELPGWKIKPESWFWQKISEAKIFRMIKGQLTQDQTVGDLEGITVLVDIRLKPKYGDMYENDWLSSIIIKLRETGKIQDFDLQSSRFNISSEETELIKTEAAQFLGLKPDQLRLEREIEANVIPQMYPHMPRKNDGKTNTWEWHEEYFEDRDDRLVGGNSVDGGLADVSCSSVSVHWVSRSFRFLVVL